MPYKSRPVCRVCEKKLTYAKEPYCLKCGKILKDKGASLCEDCGRFPHAFLQNRALLCYDAVTRPAIYRLKYAGRREYAKTFAKMTREHLGSWITRISPDCIVPVPLHASRRRKRGYNQAQLFGAALSRLTGIPLETSLVIRRKKTVPQKELSRHQREKNLKKAFKIRRNDVKLGTVLLVDDIYTTGSTLDALSSLLKEEFGCRVYCLTITIGADQGGR